MLKQKDFLLSILYSQSTIKVIFFLLVILSAVQSRIVKREICNNESPPDKMYCSPVEADTYKIGQDVVLSWNPVNNLFFGTDSEKQVEIYLIRRRQNASGIEEPVMLNPPLYNNISAPISSAYMSFTVETSWLPKYNYSVPSNNERHTFIFRVIPKNADQLNMDLSNYSSPSFVVLGQTQPNSTMTAAVTKLQQTTTSVPNVTGAPSTNSESPKKINKPDNSASATLIVVSSIAIFLAFIAIVIAIRNRKRANNQPKHQSLSNLSANSTTPIIGKFGGNNRDLESIAEGESIHSTTPLTKEEMRSKPKSTVSFSSENQPISASDAALLSDAFRKVLRKPDWKSEDEDDDDTNLSQEERLRRREAKELMKRELAEEGTDLQSISRKHTKVEIRNISNELEKDSASHSSESGSK